MTDAVASQDLRTFLSRQSLFEEMSPEDLDTLLGMARVRELEPGDHLFREDEPGEAMYFVIDGKLEITKYIEGRTDLLATRGPGEVIGEMSVVTADPRVATATAVEKSRVLEIDHAAFRTMMTCSGSAALTIMRTMGRRLRTTEAALQEQERLASLGTMAAGLAHELNNPAAAIVRSSEHLSEAHDATCRALFDFTLAVGHEPRAVSTLRSQHERVLRAREEAQAAYADGIRPREQSVWEAEDAIRGTLERQGVGRAWELAPIFAQCGLEADVLMGMLDAYPVEARAFAARFLAATLEGEMLLHDTAAAARAISQIVQAVKSYTFLDQAPVQDVDLHVGIDDTLAILRHKLKKGVAVERSYAPDLPRIEAYGSQLNQVWTNLIDNAVDAMDGIGNIHIRTTVGRVHVVVEICDDGPGMPEDVAARAFDPFFTTKAMGKGTGLGLHTVHRIVTRHRGTVELRRNPAGRGTCACVMLPVRMAGDAA